MTDGGGGSPSGDGASGLEEIRLARADPAPWGFRLMGGRDYSQPLTVTRVLGCSLAERAGLKVGDVVVSVNAVSIRSATHMEAQTALVAAGDTITLGVARGPMEMPLPLEVDLPLIQPPLAHEPTPVPEGAAEEKQEEQQSQDQDQNQNQDQEQSNVEIVVVEADEKEQADGGEDKDEDEDVEDDEQEEEEEGEEESEEEEDEEERKARLNKLDGIRPRMVRSPGPEDILRMQEKALARMERARERKDRAPTTFMLPPDRPIIRQPRAPRARPPDPPFKRLVQERIRRRKWTEEHPGEEYPFEEDEAGRTPTPDSQLTTRATMTPTPTSDLAELDDISELVDQEASLDDDRAGGRSGRSSAALREDGTVSQASRRTDEPEPEPEPEEPEEVLTSTVIAETERRLEEVTAQLEALGNLPRSLRPSVEHIKEELQEVVAKLLEQLDELRRREEEARLAAEAAVAAAAEAAEAEVRERREVEERAERERQEAVRRTEAEAAAKAKPSFKTDVPDFIHEMTEKLSLERPSFPLTPLPRPIVLPGGRKWRTVADAFNEDFIAETLTSQAEVLLGKALGNRRLSNTFPALVHERAEINESCYGCGRINFHKYSHKHDNLKSSAVYRMVHGLDDQPAPPIAERPEKIDAIDDYYQAAARQSAAPSPITELERVTAEVRPGSRVTLTPQSG